MINWNVNPPPSPPFIASIFNYYLSDDLEGYAHHDQLTIELAKKSPGFLGYESFKSDGRGSFISYWKDMESLRIWATNPDHIEAKKLGASKWYKYYHSEIAEVTSFRSHHLNY
jgi:heme-degrading monooxygenase HmoA